MDGPYDALLRGRVPAQAVAPLASYLDHLARWSARINLTGLTTPEERVRGLVESVAPLAPLLLGERLLDIGSGNGSPGLVLALLRPDLRVTLLEPRARRWAFLREAARVTGAQNVDAQRCRHDGYMGPQVDTVTVRALSLPPSEVLPLTRPGARLWVLGEVGGDLAGWKEEAVPRSLSGRAHHFSRCST